MIYTVAERIVDVENRVKKLLKASEAALLVLDA